MNISDLCDSLEASDQCQISDPSGAPEDHELWTILPEDLRYFYSRTDGASLFISKPFGVAIPSLSELGYANPKLLGKFYEKHKSEIDKDRSAEWLLIARGSQGYGMAISLDTAKDRIGWCYDSFHEVHATGDSQVVAKSFSELLEKLFEAKGETIFWEEEGFISLGKAYDN